LEAIKENWPILSTNEATRRRLYTKTVRICYTNHPSIRTKLVKAKVLGNIDNTSIVEYNPPQITYTKFPAKNIKCRITNCYCCPQLKESHDYVSFQTQKRYGISNIYSCDSTGLIYLLECSHCYKQYIGETHTKMSTRLKHHRKHPKTYTDRPLYAHLKDFGLTFKSYKLTIIHQLKDTQTRKSKEKDLIKELKTYVPFGFNVRTKT